VGRRAGVAVGELTCAAGDPETLEPFAWLRHLSNGGWGEALRRWEGAKVAVSQEIGDCPWFVVLVCRPWFVLRNFVWDGENILLQTDSGGWM